jgi:hypothetical protein
VACETGRVEAWGEGSCNRAGHPKALHCYVSHILFINLGFPAHQSPRPDVTLTATAQCRPPAHGPTRGAPRVLSDFDAGSVELGRYKEVQVEENI